MDEDWAAVRRSPASRSAAARLAAAEPVVATLDVTDLGQIVSWLRPSRHFRSDQGPGPARAASVLQAMLRSQRVHPLVPRAILQAVLPGLVGVARRLAWGAGGEWEDGGSFLADVLDTAWEVIVQWSGDDRDYAVLDLLSAVRCRLRRRLVHHRALAQRPAAVLDPGVEWSVPWRRGATDLDELVRAIEDVTGNEIDEADAAVLYAHRVLGYTMTELAALTGRTRRHLGARRDRAVRAVLA